MKEDRISPKQLMTLIWVALLSPAMELLPDATVGIAGRGAWITPLLVAPLMVVIGLLLVGRLGRGGNLQGGLETTFGKIVGRGILLLYIVWGTLLLGLRLRLSAQRLLGAGYRAGGFWFFLLAVAVLAVWMAWGKLSAFARTIEIFFGILLIVIIVVVGLSAFQIDIGNLLPLWSEDILPTVSAMPVVGGVMGYAIFATLLIDHVEWTAEGKSRWIIWTLGGCAVLAVVQLVILGNFGPVLTQRLESPFFALAKSVGLTGAFQRVESIVIAIWTLADLAILGLLLRGVSASANRLIPKVEEQVIAGCILVPTIIIGWIVIPNGHIADELSSGVALLGNLVLGWGIPIIIIVVGYMRGGKG